MALISRLAPAGAIALCMALAAGPVSAMGGGGGGASQPSGNQNWPSQSSKAKPSEYKDAVSLIKDDKCADAIPLLEKAVEKSPKDADIYNYLGYCQRKLGSYSDSFENYRKALTLDPNHAGAREYVGELFLDLNRLPDAETQLEQLNALCKHGKGCLERDTLAKAIDAYKAKQAGAPTATPTTSPDTH